MVKLIDTPSYTIRVCWEIRFRPVCLFVRTRPSPSGSFVTQLDVFLSNYPSQLLTVISPRRLDANLLLWGTFSFHVLPGREDACFSSIPVAISALVASDVRLEVTLLGFYFYCCRPITVEIIFLPSLTHNRFALHCCLWFAFGKCSWRCCTRFSLVCFNYCQRRRTCNPTTSSFSLSLSLFISAFPLFLNIRATRLETFLINILLLRCQIPRRLNRRLICVSWNQSPAIQSAAWAVATRRLI